MRELSTCDVSYHAPALDPVLPGLRSGGHCTVPYISMFGGKTLFWGHDLAGECTEWLMQAWRVANATMPLHAVY